MTTNALIDWLSNYPEETAKDYAKRVEKSLLQFSVWAGKTKVQAAKIFGVERSTFAEKLRAQNVVDAKEPKREVVQIWEAITRGKSKKAVREQILPYLLKMESSPMKDASDADRIIMLEELMKEIDNTTLLLQMALEELSKALAGPDVNIPPDEIMKILHGNDEHEN